MDDRKLPSPPPSELVRRKRKCVIELKDCSKKQKRQKLDIGSPKLHRRSPRIFVNTCVNQLENTTCKEKQRSHHRLPSHIEENHLGIKTKDAVVLLRKLNLTEIHSRPADCEEGLSINLKKGKQKRKPAKPSYPLPKQTKLSKQVSERMAENLTDSGSSDKAKDKSTSHDRAREAFKAFLEMDGMDDITFPPELHHRMFAHFRRSTSSSRAHQLLQILSETEDEEVELQCITELSQLLVMGNEETLTGFPVKQAIPVLIRCLKKDHNFDLSLVACRSLNYMMESLPPSLSMMSNAIPVLIGKLQSIECLDVAEQALVALEILSARFSQEILELGGVCSALLYFEFFPISSQRQALGIAANCAKSVRSTTFKFVADAIPALTNRLQHQDLKSVEYSCLAFSGIINGLARYPDLLTEVCSHGLLQSLQQLLLVSPPVVTGQTVVLILKMLRKLCQYCPSTSVQLIKLNIGSTLKYLLQGAEEIQPAKRQPLKSPAELLEFLRLSSELLPPLPSDITFVMNLLKDEEEVLWQYEDENKSWVNFDDKTQNILNRAYQLKQSPLVIASGNKTVIMDLSAMIQIEKHSSRQGKIRFIEKASEPAQEEPEDPRLSFWKENTTLYEAFIVMVFPLLYQEYETADESSLQQKSLECILRFLYYSRKEIVMELLKDVPFSSQISANIGSTNLNTAVTAIQMTNVLIQKLPDIFHTYFRREGVMHQLHLLEEKTSQKLVPPVRSTEEPEPILPSPEPRPQPPGSPSGRERFTSALRRSSSRLKRMLYKRTVSSESPAPEPQSSTSKILPSASKQSSKAQSSFEKSSYRKIEPKENVKVLKWIEEQCKRSLEAWKYTNSKDSHPSFVPLHRLQLLLDKLLKDSKSGEKTLDEMKKIFLDTSTKPTAFEMLHTSLPQKLLSFLTAEEVDSGLPHDKRVQLFLKYFSQGDGVEGRSSLLQQLHLCLGRVEQFPTFVHELQGMSSASQLMISQQPVTFKLERHPSDTVCKKWCAGHVRIDPLATIDSVEKFLIGRKFHFPQKHSESSSKDSEEDEQPKQLMPNHRKRHIFELLIGDTVLPYNITVMEVLSQSWDSPSTEQSSPMELLQPKGKHLTVYYRLAAENEDEDSEKVLEGLDESFSRDSPHSSLKIGRSNSYQSSLGVQTVTAEHKLAVACSKVKNDIALPVGTPSEVAVLLNLIRVLHILFSITSTNELQSEFINSKLTYKANRQLSDVLCIATGKVPHWLRDLPSIYPFLFPYDLRQRLFFATGFDKDRAILRLQGQHVELQSDRSDGLSLMSQLEKKRFCIKRNNILQQAIDIIGSLGNSKGIAEIHYDDEVGTGLGPTLEFYTLVSRDLQRADLKLWRGDLFEDSDPVLGLPEKYVFNHQGLFPAPLSEETDPSEVQRVCDLFNFLGKFLARALLDFRLVDIPLSPLFFKWILSGPSELCTDDLKYIDPTLASSFEQIRGLTDGSKLQGNNGTENTIDSLELDFTLPGQATFELKHGGKDIKVNYENLPEYLQLVADWILVRGVYQQMEAFREGFSSVFPLKLLNIFEPDEIETLLCGNESVQWSIKELQECCKPDHGYSHDSKVVQYLLQLLTSFQKDNQRKFLQFITGSPRLPTGGFRSLHPPLTIVRKAVEQNENPDNYLPSVMTCMNYLKLPEYSSMEIMQNRLLTAINEGQLSFHLS